MAQADLGAPRGETFSVKRDPWTPLSWAGVVLGIIGLMIGGILLAIPAEGRLAGAVLATVGAILFFGTGTRVFSRRLTWRISPFQEGMIVVAGHCRTDVRFPDLAASSYHQTERYANGNHAGLEQRLRFWRKQDPPQRPFVDIHAYIKTKGDEGRTEILRGLAEQAAQEVTRKLLETLAAGGTVRTPSLQLTRTHLRVDRENLPIEEITAVGEHDGKICLWRGEDLMPSARLDPDAPNTGAIMNIVGRWIAQRDAGTSPPPGRLGRILFERKSSAVIGWILLVVGVPLISLFGLGLLLMWAGWGMIRGRLYCHEFGVRQRTAFKEKRLAYTDVASFTYSATRNYYNGAYIGTSLGLVFEPEDGKSMPKIKYRTSIRNADRDLDNLCSHISAVLAPRLLRRLEEAGEFAWTPTLTVTPDGLRYRKGKFLGKGEWVMMPFSEYRGLAVEQGVLSIFSTIQDKPVYTAGVNGANFFPAMHAFELLTTAAENQ